MSFQTLKCNLEENECDCFGDILKKSPWLLGTWEARESHLVGEETRVDHLIRSLSFALSLSSLLRYLSLSLSIHFFFSFFFSFFEVEIPSNPVCPFVGRSVGLSVIISLKVGKFYFHSPIGELVDLNIP